jgi:hypothetical protein
MAMVITNWPMIRQTVGDVFAAVRTFWDTILAPAISGIVDAFQRAVLWIQFNWPRIQAMVEAGAKEVERVYNAVIKPAVEFVISRSRRGSRPTGNGNWRCSACWPPSPNSRAHPGGRDPADIAAFLGDFRDRSLPRGNSKFTHEPLGFLANTDSAVV